MFLLLLILLNFGTLFCIIYYLLIVWGVESISNLSPVVLAATLTLIVFLLFVHFFKDLSEQFSAWISSKPVIKINVRKNWSVFLVLMLLIGVFVFLYAHPFEEFFGGRDPGVYVATADYIAKNDSIKIDLPLLRELGNSENLDKLFHKEPRPPKIGHMGHYFIGFYIIDSATGELLPQFFHLAPVLAAFWIKVFGLYAVRFFMITLTVIVSLLLYRFLINYVTKQSIVALLGVLIWVTSPALLYWSRSFNSELVALFFLLLFLINAASYFERRRNFYLLFSLISLIALLFTRGDMIFFVPLGLIIIIAETKAKLVIVKLLGFSIALAICIKTLYMDAYPYLFGQFGPLVKGFGIDSNILYDYRYPIPLVIGVVTFLFGLVLYLFRNAKLIMHINSIMLREWAQRLFPLFAFIFSILFLFVYQFRSDGDFYKNATNLVKLTWYVGGIIGSLGIICGTVLYLQSVLKGSFSKYRKVLVVALLFILGGLALQFLIRASITPDHPWWSRRQLVYAILLLPVGVSFLMSKYGRQFKFASAVVLLALLVTNIYYAKPILSAQVYQGSYSYLNQLNACFEENTDSAIFFDTSYGNLDFQNRTQYISAYFLGQPLWMFFNQAVFYPKDKLGSKDMVVAMKEELVKGKNVYVINPAPLSFQLLSGKLTEVCSLPLTTSQIGWKSIVNPTMVLEDTRLSDDSDFSFTLPVQVYRYEP